MTHLALLILPRAVFPEAFHHVKLSLLVLRFKKFDAAKVECDYAIEK